VLTAEVAIINMMALACTSWGRGFIYLTWSFWWVDVVLSVAVCISMPYIVMSRHKPELQTVTAAMLLTVVPAVVAAGTGSLIADILPNTGHAFATLAVSYVLWGIGVLFTGCILALYFQRLTLHSLPAKEVIVSVFLPLGPMGQGGFGAQELGKVAITILPETTAFRPLGLGTAQSGEILYVMGVFLGLVMWGFGMVWLAIALISIRTTKDFPFNMGWWGFTFPLGTMAACSGSLATNLDSDFFKVATMVCSLGHRTTLPR
jgi:tellurite resistance protein TehA-like permease